MPPHQGGRLEGLRRQPLIPASQGGPGRPARGRPPLENLMSPRKSNLESTIYFGDDGWWHGRVTMGVLADGSPDRRHRMARTEPAVRRKVRELEKLRDEGRAT